MKKISYLMLSLIILLASCSKNENVPTNTDDVYFLTCKIDGESYTSSVVVATVLKSVFDEVELETTTITSADGQYGRILLSRVKEINNKTGTVRVNYVMSRVTENEMWTSSFEDQDTSAEFIITNEEESSVEGTFFFEGTNAEDNSIKNITEGKFMAKK